MTETTETPVATMRYRWELREDKIGVPAIVNMLRAGGPLIHRISCWEAGRAGHGTDPDWPEIDEDEVQAVFLVRRMMRRLEIAPDEKKRYVVPGLCQLCCIEKIWQGRIQR